MKVAKLVYGEQRNQVPTMAVVAFLYIAVNLLLLWLATWAQKKYVGEKKLVVPMVGTGRDGSV
jgi:glutamate transport system permease protein